MTLNACQLYLQQNVFNGVICPLPPFTQPIQAFIQPPVPGTIAIDQPQVYIWGATWRDMRIAIPRAGVPGNVQGTPPGPAGLKQKVYNMQLYIVALTPAQGPNVPYPDSAFALVINAVENAMYTAVMPQDLTDPTTKQQSQMLNLGEEIVGDYDVPRTLQDQRYLRYECRLTVTLTEIYQD